MEGDLRRDVTGNIKRHLDMGSYRGLRHRKKFAGARPAYPHQRAHPQRAAQDGRRQKDGALKGLTGVTYGRRHG